MSLWVIHGPHWTLPVDVEEMEDTEVLRLDTRCGVEIPGWWRDVLHERLKGYALHKEGTVWSIEKNNLKKIGEPAPGVNPYGVVMWRPGSEVKIPSGEAAFTEQITKDFLDEFVRKGYAKNWLTARVYWSAFNRHMLEWLINHRRPIPMSFGKLWTVPFRPNWPEVIASDLGDLSTLNKEPSDEQTQDCRLLMFDSKNRIALWSLHFNPNMCWWKSIIKSELAQRAKLSGRYWDKMIKVMRAFKPITKRLFRGFMRQALKPYVVVRPRKRDSGSRGTFAALKKGEKSNGTSGTFHWTPTVLGKSDDRPDPPCPDNHPGAKDGLLQAVSDLQQEADDMRDGGGQVCGNDGGGDSDGLPVLHADEKLL